QAKYKWTVSKAQKSSVSRRQEAIFNKYRNNANSTKAANLRGDEIIRSVFSYLTALTEKLGETAQGTIFSSPILVASAMTGLSESTIRRVAIDGIERKRELRRVRLSRKECKERALRHLDAFDQEIIQRHISDCFRNQILVTTDNILEWCQKNIDGWYISRSTLFKCLKAMGYVHKISRFDPKLTERGMVPKTSWQLATPKTWKPSATSTRDGALCPGPPAGKARGVRAIVLATLMEDGIVSGTEEVILSSGRSVDLDDDYHKDMNSHNYFLYVQRVVPLLIAKAAGAPVVLVVDNAMPTKSKKEALLKLLDDFLAKNGGRNAVKKYEVDEWCQSQGVKILRLPPYHCVLNPIELCWSQLKRHLRNEGTTNDKVDTDEALEELFCPSRKPPAVQVKPVVVSVSPSSDEAFSEEWIFSSDEASDEL
ncbi:unnamed protein product, partial [Caenorhabditis auriculariae]